MAATKGIEMGLVAIAVTMLYWVGAAVAQSSCTNMIVGMAPCLSYITGNSSNPSSSCCQQLSSVVQSQPQCLCQVLNGSAAATLGIAINQTLALSLPAACNVQTPSISACNAVNGPSTSLAAESPVGSPYPTASTTSNGNTDSTTPPVADSPSGTGSKTVPSTGVETSKGTRITKLPLHLLVLMLLFVASFVSTLTSF
ncbi:non-specific lipid transfer protein GPI-anchored 5-like [Telopea speciosissima]|uniref:non-specific lipid transfer protein GPI-anchored 5-like n=1 Tax=Telopea speciosissima TaxID=54955 RepID=UPI001CC7DE52|nr:non-specific lipid transfer protein GPI-anchored 5-like [Telopea speciosissima]